MKTAIILGASRGLGLGLAQELVKRGWQVVATQRSPSEALAAVAGVTVENVDIDDVEAVQALVARQKLSLIHI
jgi:NAD(P)-dependent dehydrogenase (short-subunit alcohol dehydrogenase family)